MTDIRTIATGLRFPEGPVAMPDGSVVLVEIERQTVTRVKPDGSTEVVAHTGGGPNGLAVGPDGAFYVCNNGGFMWRTEMNLLRPAGPASDYTGGRIERVDPKTGAVTVLYDRCGPHSCLGRTISCSTASAGFISPTSARHARATATGAALLRAGRRLEDHRGRASDPDAERHRAVSGRQDALRRRNRNRAALGIRRGGTRGPGQGTIPFAARRAVDGWPRRVPTLRQPGGRQCGNVCVATLVNGSVSVVAPGGGLIRQLAMPDMFCTNICFGGPDLRTAYLTLSGTGALVAMTWPDPGLRLAHQS